MPRQIIINQVGQQIVTDLLDGAKLADGCSVLWCWKKDGEPNIQITANQMERLVIIEMLKDANGKQIYDKVITGINKKMQEKIPARIKKVYLKNKQTLERFLHKDGPIRLAGEV